jgi:multidrug transporter EmrE-like cation transporter
MTEQAMAQRLQQRAQQLRKAAIALVVIVAAQVVALEVVLRGWQGGESFPVFSGIGVSALLCALSIIVFLRMHPRREAATLESKSDKEETV